MPYKDPAKNKACHRRIYLLHRGEPSFKARAKVNTQRYRKKHLADIKRKRALSYWKNREANLAYSKAHRLENLDRARAQDRAAYHRNPERNIANTIRWQKAHPERNREINRRACDRYQAKNPHVRAAVSEKRRALKMGATVDPKSISAFMGAVRRKRTFVCYYCKRRRTTKRVHFDHIIPLCKGGQHAVGNLCASCDTCNLSKNAKLPQEWQKHAQAVMNL